MDLPKYYRYRQLDNGVHEFTLLVSSRAAVDEMAKQINDIMSQTPVTANAACYLIDHSQVEAIPLVYTRNELRKLDVNRPAGLKPGRVAILYDGVMRMIANTIIDLAISTNVRFFKPTERDKALAWLLNEE